IVDNRLKSIESAAAPSIRANSTPQASQIILTDLGSFFGSSLFLSAVSRSADQYHRMPVQTKNAKSMGDKSLRLLSYKGPGTKLATGIDKINAGKFSANATLSAGPGSMRR